MKSLLAIKGLEPKSAAVTVDKIIHKLVVQRLVNRARSNFRPLKNNLCIQLPISNVIDRHDHWPAERDIPLHHIEVFKVRDTLNLGLRERWHLESAHHIGPESRKMPKCQAAEIRLEHLICKRNRQIFPCEPPVAGQDKPHQSSDRLP